MFYVNPMYTNFFMHDPTGHLMLGAAIGMQLIGYAVIRRSSRSRSETWN